MSSDSLRVATEPPASPWAPLRNAVFRSLWVAVLGSQIGTWMQTVGAQWLLVDRPNAPTLVSLVQTAMMLPMLLLAVPAGVLADALDRRRMLMVVQWFQAATGAVLTVLTLAGQMTPALLLTLTFVLGCGGAMTIPTYQALIPDLVPRAQLTGASALGAISMNLARAVGPAVAGVLVARVGPRRSSRSTPRRSWPSPSSCCSGGASRPTTSGSPSRSSPRSEPGDASCGTPPRCAGSCCVSRCSSCRASLCGRSYRWSRASGWRWAPAGTACCLPRLAWAPSAVL